MRSYLRSLDPRLSREVWTLLCGSFANAFGNGVVFPYLLIYLHNVRDISLGVAGVVLAVSGIASLVGGTVAGAVVDRVGAKGTLVFAQVAAIVGFGGFGFVHDAPEAFVLAIVIGIGNGAFWPSHAALVAGLTSRETRHNAYAMQRVLNNLGIGLGGLVGGLIATTANPVTYESLFVIDAVTFVVYLGLLAFVSSPPPHKREPDAEPHGYRQVQLPVTRWLEGRRRMMAHAIEGVIWAASWVTVAAAGVWLFGTQAAVVFAIAFSVFAVGECFHGTVKNTLTADLARPGLLGRYLALDAAGIVVGGAVGCAAGGFMLASAPDALWIAAAIVALAGGAYALALEPRLPGAVRKTPHAVPPPLTLAEAL